MRQWKMSIFDTLEVSCHNIFFAAIIGARQIERRLQKVKSVQNSIRIDLPMQKQRKKSVGMEKWFELNRIDMEQENCCEKPRLERPKNLHEIL